MEKDRKKEVSVMKITSKAVKLAKQRRKARKAWSKLIAYRMWQEDLIS